MFFKFFIENKNFFQEIHKINKMLNNKFSSLTYKQLYI